MANVLLIEDDQHIADILRFYLDQAAHQTNHAVNAQAALRVAKTMRFDIILLDIMLPDIDGIELCAELRKFLYCPILFISCIDNEKTIIQALRMGGDDYLVKPFTREMLCARMDANLRRMQRIQHPEQPPRIDYESFTLDIATHSIIKNGTQRNLSPIEYNILRFLMEHPDRHFTLTQIYETIWERPSLGDARTVMVHIHNLRKKIEDNPNEPKYIKSARRNGYYFSANAQS